MNFCATKTSASDSGCVRLGLGPRPGSCPWHNGRHGGRVGRAQNTPVKPMDFRPICFGYPVYPCHSRGAHGLNPWSSTIVHSCWTLVTDFVQQVNSICWLLPKPLFCSRFHEGFIFYIPSSKIVMMILPTGLGRPQSVSICLEIHVSGQIATSWWLNQPIWKLFVKMGSSSTNRDEN